MEDTVEIIDAPSFLLAGFFLSHPRPCLRTLHPGLAASLSSRAKFLRVLFNSVGTAGSCFEQGFITPLTERTFSSSVSGMI